MAWLICWPSSFTLTVSLSPPSTGKGQRTEIDLPESCHTQDATAEALACRRYYLNGCDAYRLKLLLPLTDEKVRQLQEQQQQQQLLQQQQLDNAPEGGPGPELSAADRQLQWLTARAAALGISQTRTVTQI